MLWDCSKVELEDAGVGLLPFSVRGRLKENNREWVLIGIYGPMDSSLCQSFLKELKGIRSHWRVHWGDFNEVWVPADRNKRGISRGMRGFSRFIDGNGLQDVQLNGAV